MSTLIHPTAIIEKGAQIDHDVEIGPYCLIGANVKIAKGTKLKSHIVLEGHTTIGENNMIHEFCSIGVAPQDKSYNGEPTQTIIGSNNLFREGVTVHRATTKENHKTVMGNNGYYMAAVHIAHDCIVGDNVTMANQIMLAGHVHIGDYVQMGGGCGIAQFCSVGRGAFIAAATAIDKDIPHFFTAMGNRVRLKGINIIGLKRRGYSKEEISEVMEFYRVMEGSTLSPRAFVEQPTNTSEYVHNSVINEIIEFIKTTRVGVPPFLG